MRAAERVPVWRDKLLNPFLSAKPGVDEIGYAACDVPEWRETLSTQYFSQYPSESNLDIVLYRVTEWCKYYEKTHEHYFKAVKDLFYTCDWNVTDHERSIFIAKKGNRSLLYQVCPKIISGEDIIKSVLDTSIVNSDLYRLGDRARLLKIKEKFFIFAYRILIADNTNKYFDKVAIIHNKKYGCKATSLDMYSHAIKCGYQPNKIDIQVDIAQSRTIKYNSLLDIKNI